MKLLFVLLTTSFMTSSYAMSELCKEKQIEAVRSNLASILRTDIANVDLVDYQEGPWNESLFERKGFDIVTVSVGRFIQDYEVYAQQIGSSEDCEILKIEF